MFGFGRRPHCSDSVDHDSTIPLLPNYFIPIFKKLAPQIQVYCFRFIISKATLITIKYNFSRTWEF